MTDTNPDPFAQWAERLTAVLDVLDCRGLAELATVPAGGDPEARLRGLLNLWKRLHFLDALRPGEGPEILRSWGGQAGERLAALLHAALTREIGACLRAGANEPSCSLISTHDLIVQTAHVSPPSYLPGRYCAVEWDSLPDGHALRQAMPRDGAWLPPYGPPVIVLCPAVGVLTRDGERHDPPPWTTLALASALTAALRAPQLGARRRREAEDAERVRAAEERKTDSQRHAERIAALEAKLAAQAK
jgi:hypothetical protein